MRLATRFTILLVAGVLVLIAVDGYLAVKREIEMFDADMRYDARELGMELQSRIADVWESGGEPRALELIEQVDETRHMLEIRWVHLDEVEDSQRPLVSAASLGQLERGQIISLTYYDPQGDEHLLTYAHVATDDSRLAALELNETVVHSEEMTRLFVLRMIILTGVTLILGLTLVLLLGKELVSKPLQLLIDKTRRIGRGDLSGPVHLPRRDEFGELGAAINTMCEQLVEAHDKVNEETVGRISALEQLRHADRLRTVGRLASGIAHEMGTPLNVVGGRAKMIASGKLSLEETTKSAEIIKSETDRITTIIRQLMDFARRNSPRPAPVEMSALVDETLDLLVPLAEKRGITFENAAKGAHFVCNVDTHQMQQVLTNLIVNAMHAMPEGGRIEIGLQQQHARPPEGEDANEGEFLLISIKDEGKGISDEDMQHLFEPFFTTKEVGEGTGLGLSIAYGIMQEHGGWIDVQSQVGEGSCFTLYLPLEGK